MRQVGRYTYGITDKSCSGQANLIVGAFCSIGPLVKFVLGNNHRTDYATTYPFGHINIDVFGMPVGSSGHPATKGDIVIGNDVWIGLCATIMSGVTIGDGAVIAANSHVVKDVEPYEIVGGNPARHIRHRFDRETIDFLLELKWWDKTDKEIRQLVPYLMSSDIDGLKERCK